MKKRDQRGHARSRASPSASVPLFGTGAKLIARISAADQHDREDAAEVVDRLGRLVDVGRDEHRRPSTSATTTSGSVTRKTDPHRSARAARRRPAARATAIAPPSADHSAIDFVRAGPRPQRRDQRQRRRIGHARRRARRARARRTAPRRSARTRPAGTPGPTAPCRAAASACARSGRRARRGRAPRRRGRASSRPRSGRASSATSRSALPMSGSATLATDRFRLATRRDQDQRERGRARARCGAPEELAGVDGPVAGVALLIVSVEGVSVTRHADGLHHPEGMNRPRGGRVSRWCALRPGSVIGVEFRRGHRFAAVRSSEWTSRHPSGLAPRYIAGQGCEAGLCSRRLG